MSKMLKLDLSNFKASGVYTLEFDASENIIINPQTTRLLIGYSNKGLFNAPVYCPDVMTFQTIFGNIDRTLEKKGSFFHRSALTALESGPIFALNLRKLNNSIVNNKPDFSAGADIARYRAFSVDTEEANGINATGDYSEPLTKQDKLLSSYYNKEKFWFPDRNYFLATMDDSTSKPDNKKLFSIVNLGQEPVSIIVKKSTDSSFPLSGFDITAKEYFGTGNVPHFMHEYDYISDWFIDVIVISGNWTDYVSLSNDPIFGYYFTPQGLNKSRIEEFLAHNNVNVILSVTGTIIPNFVDKNGTIRYIQTLINNETARTGIFCVVNEEALDNIHNNPSVVDLVGHHLIDEIGPNADIVNKYLNFLSYEQKLFSDYTYERNVAGETGGSPLDDGSGHILTETGTLFTFNNTTGADTSLFENYDPSLRENGALVLISKPIDTSNQSIIESIYNFINDSNGSNTKWLVGKVDSNIPSGLGFNADEFIKLKIKKSVIVTDNQGQKRLKILLTHPLVTQDPSTTYVALFINTVNSINYYQIGNSDCIERIQDSSTLPYYLIAYENSPIYKNWLHKNIDDESVIWKAGDGTDLQYIKFESNVDRDEFNYLKITAYSNADHTSQEDIIDWGQSYISSLPYGINGVNAGEVNIVSSSNNINDYIPIIQQIDSNTVEITSNDANNFNININDLIVSTDTQIYDNSQLRLTRILEIKNVPIPNQPGSYNVHIKTERPIKIYSGQSLRILRLKSIEEFTTNLTFTYLPGCKVKSHSIPDGTDDRVNEILDVIFETNIGKSLIDNNIISFRYIVDTFDGVIRPNSKYQLSKLAKNRQKCLAICNAPSIKKFKDSIEPRFTAIPTDTDPYPLLEVRYIVDGGNLSLNPSFTFSLPNEDLGAKYAGFFSPFITIRDIGEIINVPPAAYVSNNFIRKFITGEPYSIVAGVKRGIITAPNIIGLEYDFDDNDRGLLETFGINPIIRKRNIGIIIYGNQTSYQRINSAFNNLHVRDLLITIEDGIENILSNYVFDFNEDNVRLEIKMLVDNYLDGVRAVGGIYNYFTIMDSSNNTPAIIDQNIGIIDIIVEPVRGIHKFINRVTVYSSSKGGGSSSNGFVQFS